jgi:hypothetical protein
MVSSIPTSAGLPGDRVVSCPARVGTTKQKTNNTREMRNFMFLLLVNTLRLFWWQYAMNGTGPSAFSGDPPGHNGFVSFHVRTLTLMIKTVDKGLESP